MELQNYRVEIIGGRHISKDNSDADIFAKKVQPSFTFFSPFSPFSPFSAFSPFIQGETKESNADKSYVEMKDNTQYIISLTNSHAQKCHAKVTIDGNDVGTWVLQPWETARIERPVDVPKKFTFFKVNSVNGLNAGLCPKDANNGLITVEFIPEVKKQSFGESWCFNTSARSDKYDMDVDDTFDTLDDDFNCLLSFDNRPLSSGSGSGSRSGYQGISRGRGQGQGRSIRSLSNSISQQSYEEGGTGLKGKSDQSFRVSNDNLKLDYNNKVTINLRLIALKTDNYDYDRVTPLKKFSNDVPPPLR